MTKHHLIVPPEERARPLNIAGSSITVLASGAQTGGYEIFHQVGPEGTGPGPHSHPWDESFYVISGEIACGVDQEETLARPGTLVHIPGGATQQHNYFLVNAELRPQSDIQGLTVYVSVAA